MMTLSFWSVFRDYTGFPPYINNSQHAAVAVGRGGESPGKFPWSNIDWEFPGKFLRWVG